MLYTRWNDNHIALFSSVAAHCRLRRSIRRHRRLTALACLQNLKPFFCLVDVAYVHENSLTADCADFADSLYSQSAAHEFRGAHAARVLVAATRRNELHPTNRSLNTPMIIASGINNTSTSAPTPSNLMIVLCRFPNDGCDFGNGGGGCVSAMPRD
jgi:hypothetical protein